MAQEKPQEAVTGPEPPEKHEGWYLDGLTEDEWREQQARAGREKP
jgi:hypothetical protein